MSNQITPIQKAFNSPDAKKKFEELLGKRASQFMTSVLSVVNNNDLLKKASWESVYSAAITAATLDLPINQNLGFAYIVPYKGEAQFQIGYKGFIQLAQRSGKFKTINVSDVREGEIENYDRLTGQIKFNWIQDDSERLKSKVVGYVAYIELSNGFSKLLYMTAKELEKHGKSYSQSFKKGYGLWQDNFEAMAEKTVIKLLLSKYSPLSTQMELALTSDQAVLTESETKYVDNNQNVTDVEATKPKSELQKFIEEEVDTIDALLQAVNGKTLTDEEQNAFNAKFQELGEKEDSPVLDTDGALMPDKKPTTL